MKMMSIVTIGITCAATLLATYANAEPVAGHDTIVATKSPSMVCQLFSAASDTSGDGAGVDCQASFPKAAPVPTEYADGTVGPPWSTPNQAMVTAAGKLKFFVGNIGMGDSLDKNGNLAVDTMTPGETHHVQGWTVVPTPDGITFTNDATSHGMTIKSAYDVTAF